MNKLKLVAVLIIAAFIVVGFMNRNDQSNGSSSPKTGLQIGEVAPELAFQNPDGKIIKLSDLRGRMVLIDFWASWCGPCRRENPNVVSAYQTYKDKKFVNGKGFTIYGVSLDRDKTAWVNAIEKDNLSWEYHVSDLQQWRSEAARIYQVNSIPANVLIDGDGVIVARNLRDTKLHVTLESLLKSRN